MIKVAKPVWRKVQRTAEGQGALFAKERVVLSNKLAGYVSAVLVDFGDQVKAGQVLAEMEREELELQVDAAASDSAGHEPSRGRGNWRLALLHQCLR